jgi:amino acid transporter
MSEPDPKTTTDQSNGGAEAEGQLERTLGLSQALTIGVGTMIGAGIFIFPGLAAGEAGLASMLSFGIGGVISVLVALCASELASAYPRSGGTYYFVSDGLGKLPGAMVGIGLWWGLVFASAFYLMGFGLYINKIIEALGFTAQVNPKALGVAAGITLTAVNVLGTEKTGKLQNSVVGILLSILGLFLTYGVLDTLGVFGSFEVPETFAPYGIVPVFHTAALVYTSYLGFGQIANVAGEIKNPSENLPKSMIGSVVLVTALYMITVFIGTSALGHVTLGELGETALVEVGRTYFDSVGVVLILAGGLLATISSANASILSSSRSVYALSDDDLLPESAGRVHQKLGTPVISIAAAGVPVVGLILVGEVEVLAEVASFLHLVLYGLLCVVVLRLRSRDPDDYNPTFSTPGYPVVPALGAVCSFGLIYFMKPASQLYGAAILAAAAGWFVLYTKGFADE